MRLILSVKHSINQTNFPFWLWSLLVTEAAMNGYTGNILRVDLTSKQHVIENPGEAFYRQYIGGSARAWFTF